MEELGPDPQIIRPGRVPPEGGEVWSDGWSPNGSPKDKMSPTEVPLSPSPKKTPAKPRRQESALEKEVKEMALRMAQQTGEGLCGKEAAKGSEAPVIPDGAEVMMIHSDEDEWEDQDRGEEERQGS